LKGLIIAETIFIRIPLGLKFESPATMAGRRT